MSDVKETILRRLSFWPLCSRSMITTTISKVPPEKIEQALAELVEEGKINRQIRKTGGNRLAEAFYKPEDVDLTLREIINRGEV